MHLTLNPASLLLPETVYVFGGNITLNPKGLKYPYNNTN
jgi:hypothetical protein